MAKIRVEFKRESRLPGTSSQALDNFPLLFIQFIPQYQLQPNDKIISTHTRMNFKSFHEVNRKFNIVVFVVFLHTPLYKRNPRDVQNHAPVKCVPRLVNPPFLISSIWIDCYMCVTVHKVYGHYFIHSAYTTHICCRRSEIDDTQYRPFS